ncbi:hypothetical protein BGX21_008506 [Mortierella sp. AD011]|nr:hypothetical protein BGX20_008684 [Mortierella sp. AD010]KAF9397790.1 hypothetical protein BGX21_008506 [Mortierella sp. AD011]
MSRPPSIYSDALDTPLQDHMNDAAGSASHQSQDQRTMDHDNNQGQGGSTVRDHSRSDMEVDEAPQIDNDVSMQVDSTTTPSPGVGSSADPTSSVSNSRPGEGSSVQQSQSRESSSASGSGSSSARTGGKVASVPVVDEQAQSELRRKIMDIQRDPSISFADKAGMIQKLMSSKWKGSQRSSDTHTSGSVEATAEDLKKTYHDEEQTILGCEHYMRGCKLQANCCGKWFNCRFCHDDVSDHTIVRSETKMMMCMHCQTIQSAAQTCSSCKANLAVYYCEVCKLWDNDSKKHIYHCDDCGICRIGLGLGQDYFHCKKCNVCMNIKLQNNHKCIERNLECDCPICGEYMFTSTTTVIFMPCGHSIHSKCHENYIRTSYQCPTCWKSLGDMSPYYSKIDSLLAEQTMPPEYANIFSIVLCNDCEVKSEAPYHFLYHKCDKCKGYNTKVLETFHRVTDGQAQVVENATASGATVAAPENNNSGSSSAHPGPVAGSSSTAATSATGSLAVPGTNVTPVNLVNVGIPRSPLMDENASGDMSMAGISGNSAP